MDGGHLFPYKAAFRSGILLHCTAVTSSVAPSHLGFQFVMPTCDSVISFTVHVFGDTCRSISVELILQVKG